MDRIRQVLERYLPPGTEDVFAGWIRDYRIHLRITRNRRSKAGDYRAPTPEDPRHRISINHDLNPYAFLITLAHELAHRVVREKYPPRTMPHGPEWKREFRELMLPFLSGNTFPQELRAVVSRHLTKISASSGSDLALSRALRKYNPPERQAAVMVEEIEYGTLFSLGDKRIFRKGHRIRKRYHCECVTNHKIYLVNGNAEAIMLNQ
jgi:SprT protein